MVGVVSSRIGDGVGGGGAGAGTGIGRGVGLGGGEALRGRIDVAFYGNAPVETLAELKDSGLEDIVSFGGSIGYLESLRIAGRPYDSGHICADEHADRHRPR